MKSVLIYTDGSCLGNPGPGGWAAILVLKGTNIRREMSGGFCRTTNNRMEITAAIESLRVLKEPCIVELFTDSQYLRDAIEKKWLDSWQKRNWRKADGKPALNVDLWQKLLPLLATHQVRFMWVRGHAGHAENERCDFLARSKAGEDGLPVDQGYEMAAK